MENASKALLIAGAILIAILLIAIGMMVFNSANGVLSSATSKMSDQERTMFNKEWEMYQGVQSGSTIKELMNKVTSNNSNDTNPKIKLNAREKDLEGDAVLGKIVNQKRYTVKIESYDNGLIANMSVNLTDASTPAANSGS